MEHFWDLPPHPYSVNKFLVFNRLQSSYRAKILSAMDLAADSSQERSYGLFSSRIAGFGKELAVQLTLTRDLKAGPSMAQWKCPINTVNLSLN